jgi:hypothetical protein
VYSINGAAWPCAETGFPALPQAGQGSRAAYAGQLHPAPSGQPQALPHSPQGFRASRPGLRRVSVPFPWLDNSAIRSGVPLPMLAVLPDRRWGWLSGGMSFPPIGVPIKQTVGTSCGTGPRFRRASVGAAVIGASGHANIPALCKHGEWPCRSRQSAATPLQRLRKGQPVLSSGVR